MKGRRLAGADTRGRLAVVEVETGELRETELEDVATAMAFSADDGTLAVGCYFRNVWLIDPATLRIAARLVGHQGSVASVAWTRDESRLLTASLDGTARVWDMTSLATRSVVATGATGSTSAGLVLAPDGEHCVTVGRELRRFRIEDPTVLRGHETFAYNVVFSPDGSLIASTGYQEPTIHLWDPFAARRVATLRAPETGRHLGSDFDAVPAVAFSSDGRRVVSASRHETVNWDVESGAALPVTEAETPEERFYATLGRRADVRITAHTVYGPDGRRADEIIGKRERPTTYCLSISADGSRVALGSGVEVVIYDDGGDAEAGRLVGHAGDVYCAAFSPDGTRIATGSNDTTVRIWDARTFEQLLVLNGHEQYVKALAFSPDGTMLASASGDFTIRIWDTIPRSGRAGSPGYTSRVRIEDGA